MSFSFSLLTSLSSSRRIPASVGACEHCALQWTYVTANTCLVDGYRKYNFPDSSWWAPHLGDCPYTKNWPRDGR